MAKKRHNPMNFFQENRDLGSGRDVNAKNLQRALDKAIVECCVEGDEDGVIDLLQKGACPEAEAYANIQMMTGENFKRPLMAAVANGHRKIANLLLENGADPCGKDRYNVQALHLASHSGHRDCITLLLAAGADADAVTADFNKPGVYKKPFRGGTTPLHMAAKMNHSDCIEELVEKGKADVDKQDVIGMTCLNTACQLGHEESVLTILRLTEGAQLKTCSAMGTGNTPLHDCVRCGLVRATEALLKRGAQVNRSNPSGYTPLHFALVQTGPSAPELVKTLIVHGRDADVNLPNEGGLRPLHLVAFEASDSEHTHHIHTIAFQMSRDHITRDPRRPRRDAQLACLLLCFGADFHIEFHEVSLLQQEIYAQDDDSILDVILRTTDSFQIPDRPHRISEMKSLAVGGAQRADRLRELFSKPRTLQHYCRLSIRKLLTPLRLNRLAEICLPDALKNYILLKY